MFDELPQPTGPLPAPAKAVAQHAEITAEPPVMGNHVDMTTLDLGSGVVMTWIPVPANGMLSVPKTPVLYSQAQFHGHAPVFPWPPPPPLPIPPNPFRPTHPQAFFGFSHPFVHPCLIPIG
jgi:hypothetical protein